MSKHQTVGAGGATHTCTRTHSCTYMQIHTQEFLPGWYISSHRHSTTPTSYHTHYLRILHHSMLLGRSCVTWTPHRAMVHHIIQITSYHVAHSMPLHITASSVTFHHSPSQPPASQYIYCLTPVCTYHTYASCSAEPFILCHIIHVTAHITAKYVT